MAGRIPKSFIDDLVDRTDLVDLIDARVPLKKAGKNYQACCPFHNEKSPSFTVSPDKQFYHCFGCGAHGNAIGFLMEYEQLEFVEAIEELANFHSLDIPREAEKGQNQSYQTLNRDQKTSAYDLMELATRFFQHQLKHDSNAPIAIEYLKNRGLSGQICLQYGIGYAPDSWDSALKALAKNNEQRQALVDLKVLTQNDNGRVFDFFRHRIMFPIRDKRGRVVGFGGRVLDDSTPKYLNSPETAIFHKGKELYGLYQAKQADPKLPRVVIVEGYMDVVALAQNGIGYAVAALGTATTGDHMSQLFRQTQQVFCCYDGDRAGREAAWRALENALPYLKDGVDLKFVFLPDGEDPDSLVQKGGKQAFEDKLNHAVPLLNYFFDHFSEQLDLTSDAGKSALLGQARPLIESIPSDYYREALTAKLSRFVGSAANDKVNIKRSVVADVRKQQTELSITPMRRAIALLLQHPQLAQTVPFIPELSQADMPGFDVLIQLQSLILQEPDIRSPVLLERFREHKAFSLLNRLFSWEHHIASDNLQAEFQDTFKSLQDAYLAKRLEQLEIKDKNGLLNREERQEYQALIIALKSV